MMLLNWRARTHVSVTCCTRTPLFVCGGSSSAEAMADMAFRASNHRAKQKKKERKKGNGRVHKLFILFYFYFLIFLPFFLLVLCPPPCKRATLGTRPSSEATPSSRMTCSTTFSSLLDPSGARFSARSADCHCSSCSQSSALLVTSLSKNLVGTDERKASKDLLI
jgi:hypothetical protein